MPTGISFWEIMLCAPGGLGIAWHVFRRLVPAGDAPKHDDHDSDGHGDDEEEEEGHDDGHGDDGHGGGHV